MDRGNKKRGRSNASNKPRGSNKARKERAKNRKRQRLLASLESRFASLERSAAKVSSSSQRRTGSKAKATASSTAATPPPLASSSSSTGSPQASTKAAASKAKASSSSNKVLFGAGDMYDKLSTSLLQEQDLQLPSTTHPSSFVTSLVTTSLAAVRKPSESGVRALLRNMTRPLQLDTTSAAFSLDAATSQAHAHSAAAHTTMGARARRQQHKAGRGTPRQPTPAAAVKPLHKLWKGYAVGAVGESEAAEHSTLLSAARAVDWHGALVTVVGSRVPSLVGLSGVVTKASPRALQIVPLGGPARAPVTVLRAYTTLRLAVGDALVLTSVGREFRLPVPA